MRTLLGIFFNPPMAVARFGASPVPQDAFEWRTSHDAHGEVHGIAQQRFG